jgi:hypothetical protein
VKRLALALALVCMGCPPEKPAGVSVDEGGTVRVRAKWEEVYSTSLGGRRVTRTKTPEGWIVTSTDGRIVYVPDPKHEWLALEPEEEAK